MRKIMSSSQCIILNKISAAKNTVFLVKLVPCRCRSQPYLLTMSILPCQIRSYFPVQKYFKVIHSATDSLREEYSGACNSICIDNQDEKLLLTL